MGSPARPNARVVENHLRSLAKAISWRAAGTLDTITISFILTGRFTLALSIGGVELVTKTVLYFLHERIWNRVRFGKATVMEYEI